MISLQDLKKLPFCANIKIQIIEKNMGNLLVVHFIYFSFPVFLLLAENFKTVGNNRFISKGIKG